MKCPQCNMNNPPDFSFCLQCGGQLPSQTATTLAQDDEPSPDPPTAFAGSLDMGDAPPSMLRVERGAVDQREFVLDKPVIIIGRRPGNDIVIHDQNVSRHHARVIQDPEGFLIQDENSANGTLVNDERVEQARRLLNGDMIRIGDAVLVFEAGQGLAPSEGMTTLAMMDGPMPVPSPEPPISLDDDRSLDSSSTSSEEMTRYQASEPSDFLGHEPATEFAPRPVQSFNPLTPPPPIRDAASEPSSDVTIDAGFPDFSAPLPPSSHPEPSTRPDPPAASAQPSPDLTDTDERLLALRQDLGDLNRDLGTFAAGLSGLIERVERLEGALTTVSDDLGQLATNVRGPAGQPLRDLPLLLAEYEASGGAEKVEPVIELLDQLTANPRDIELLLGVSRQAPALADLLRLHLRFVSNVPDVREALDRILS